MVYQAIIVTFLCHQVAGDIVQVAGNMQFGMWIGGQRVSETEMPSDSSAPPSTTPIAETTTIVTTSSTTTLAPPPQCPNFTRIPVSDATQGINETISQAKLTFDECCSGSGLTPKTNIFSYENDTCSYYSAWLDPNEVGQEDGANLEGKLFFTRTDGPDFSCYVSDSRREKNGAIFSLKMMDGSINPKFICKNGKIYLLTKDSKIIDDVPDEMLGRFIENGFIFPTDKSFDYITGNGYCYQTGGAHSFYRQIVNGSDSFSELLKEKDLLPEKTWIGLMASSETSFKFLYGYLSLFAHKIGPQTEGWKPDAPLPIDIERCAYFDNSDTDFGLQDVACETELPFLCFIPYVHESEFQ